MFGSDGEVDPGGRHRGVARVQCAVGEKRLARVVRIERAAGRARARRKGRDALARRDAVAREPTVAVAAVERVRGAVLGLDVLHVLLRGANAVAATGSRSRDRLGVAELVHHLVVDVPAHGRAAVQVVAVGREGACELRPVVRQRDVAVGVSDAELGEVLTERQGALDGRADLARMLVASRRRSRRRCEFWYQWLLAKNLPSPLASPRPSGFWFVPVVVDRGDLVDLRCVQVHPASEPLMLEDEHLRADAHAGVVDVGQSSAHRELEGRKTGLGRIPGVLEADDRVTGGEVEPEERTSAVDDLVGLCSSPCRSRSSRCSETLVCTMLPKMFDT